MTGALSWFLCHYSTAPVRRHPGGSRTSKPSTFFMGEMESAREGGPWLRRAGVKANKDRGISHGRNIAHPSTHRFQGLISSITRKTTKKEGVKREWRKEDFIFLQLEPTQGASGLRNPRGTSFNAAIGFLFSTGLENFILYYSPPPPE